MLADRPPIRPELLAPAGDWDCARAAVENGADAIYFGLDRFNARMRAHNFTQDDLPQLMDWLHRRGVRGYLTLNTLVFTEELAAVEDYLRGAIAAGVDAAIVQDVGLARLIRHISPDFPIHASTQMTITSAAGVAFAQALGCQLVVLARECTIADIRKIQDQITTQGVALPLETFVHGALCVAYSGQCLTSEALGGRSANRGECAQACRMTYDLIADGQRVDLGDRAYLLSPQDLAGFPVLPDLIRAGVASLKIEGRLKDPDYVASVTRTYRAGIERAIASLASTSEQSHLKVNADDRYTLAMAFSRGLHTGWFEGVNNQALVRGDFAKKRGAFLGEVVQVQRGAIGVRLAPDLRVKPGDGVVFAVRSPHQDARTDSRSPAQTLMEIGGRVYGVEIAPAQQRSHGAVWIAWLTFGRDLDLRPIHPGAPVWKTSDPELTKQIRHTYAGDRPRWQRPIHLTIRGRLGEPLSAIAHDDQGHQATAQSASAAIAADHHPLNADRLRDYFGKLGNTPFYCDRLDADLVGDLLLPAREMNQMRRSLVAQLETARSQAVRWTLHPTATYRDLTPSLPADPAPPISPRLIALVRNRLQLQAAIATGVDRIYCEFENPATYREALIEARSQVADHPNSVRFWVAPPRITKPKENWILEQVRRADADGYLVRNYDHLVFFGERGDRCVGDFSLNIANPLTATYFKHHYRLERLTASYDLNVSQLEHLLQACPPDWFEVTIHQHMPLFHMEHCVFCAFLSDGTDYTNCGRPCETHPVTLRDRTGVEHVLSADAGCRNTVFNGTPQTGAEFSDRLIAAGANHLRVEFVNESPAEVTTILQTYQRLLTGEIRGAQLWRSLQHTHGPAQPLTRQLGVTVNGRSPSPRLTRGQLATAETPKVTRKPTHQSARKPQRSR